MTLQFGNMRNPNSKRTKNNVTMKYKVKYEVLPSGTLVEQTDKYSHKPTSVA